MDYVSDALTRIRNATQRKSEDVELKKNKIVLSMMDVLKREEFIEDYTEEEDTILVTLKYEEEKSMIHSLERVSSGGQRSYVSASEMRPVLNGRGIGIISTSSGVMTTEEARDKNVGGEYICKIW